MPSPADPVVLGLDLSLTSTGAVVLPADWSGEWDVPSMHFGRSVKNSAQEAQRIRRLVRISGEVCDFAKKHEVTHAFVEGYAFNQRGAHARSGAELGGVVKVMIGAWGFTPIETVVASQARKLLCGKVPRKDAKAFVHAKMREWGAKFSNGDEADAFVIANYGRHTLGLSAMANEGV